MRGRPGLVLSIVSLGLVLANIDLFVVNVALPAIAEDLRPGDLGVLSWTLNAYAIVFAALLVPLGRLADRAGRKGGFLIGVGVFTLASVACAASTDIGQLVAFRVVQAVGAAMMLPTSLGLVLDAYPPARRFGAVRIWAAVGSGAVALAPVVAGPLTDLSWRWVFLINVPLGLVALVAGWLVLPNAPGEGGPVPDLLGAGLLTFAISALTLGLTKGPDWGWSSSGVVGSLVAAVVLTALFLARSARHPSPVFELGLLRLRPFLLGSLATMLFAAALAQMLLSAVLWTQEVWHWSALMTGLAILPGPALVPVWSIVAGKVLPKLGPGKVVALGSLAFGLGVLWWSWTMAVEPDYFAGMFGGMCLTGVGVGLAMPTLFGAAASALPPQRFATGSGVVNMIRQIGLTVGVAVLVVVTANAVSPADRLVAFQRVWVVAAVIAVGAGVVGYLLGSPARRATPNAQPVASPEAPASDLKAHK
ncbi:MAG: MFS transporter [Saccharothrix sp.]|nr:MFS transporter [Saccharothrix sp.]